jgi:hypothetical protein
LSRPIHVLHDGHLTAATGWSRSIVFRVPFGRGEVRGYLAESADAVTLRRVWPSLCDVDFFVDTQVVGLNRLIATALRLPAGGRLFERLVPTAVPLARLVGSYAGPLEYQRGASTPPVRRRSSLEPVGDGRAEARPKLRAP